MSRIQTDPREVAEMAARLVRAYPQLSCYSASELAVEIYAVERAARRDAIRACNGEFASTEDEQRSEGRVQLRCAKWIYHLATLVGSPVGVSLIPEGDPRGCVLQLHHLPGHSEPVRV